MMEEDIKGANISAWPRRTVRFGVDRPRASSFLDLSRISTSQDFSLEAIAGNSNSLHESGEPDLRAEISDLHLQVQKLNEDNVVLKTRVTAAQDENFTLLQLQKDEVDKKEMEFKMQTERLKRLERELGDKNMLISSLEDRNTVLSNRNARLENECSAYLKERKEIVIEGEEMKGEYKKSLRIVVAKDEEIERLKTAAASVEKQWQEKFQWLNHRNDILTQKMEEMSPRIDKLESEKADLETKLSFQKSEPGRINRFPHHPPMLFQVSHQDSFDMDISTDDIQTELLAAEGRFPQFDVKPCTERFDVAIQCSNLEQPEVKEEDVEALYALASEISDLLYSIHQMTTSLSSSTAADDEVCKVDQMPNGSGGASGSTESMMRRKKKKRNKGADDASASINEGSPECDQLSNSNATVVVRQINQELTEFREQLKKSQELFAVLRYNSCQSVSKSCPGLSIDPSDSLSKSCSTNNNSKAVSCATQTDSPVIETPILAQKLSLGSSQQQDLIMSRGGLPDYLSNDSMDNPSFDKLSDDGSVRVRDDLSMVLEVSEQETETSPGPGRRTMSLDKGNRPKLVRMPNATHDEEEDDHRCTHSRSDSGHSNNHHSRSGSSNHHLGVEDGLNSDNDYVSATSSQAESVYLSLERPLKVSSKDDRSSAGNYRSCASSIRSGSISRGAQLGGDGDTASIVSEGNTTFGSPLSSPSSPYWTPSQGSSSQETITDGDRTPVNQYHSNLDICSGLGVSHRSQLKGSPSQSEPSGRTKGVVDPSEIRGCMIRAFDPTTRGTDTEPKLKNNEWRLLRGDIDRNDHECFIKTYAQQDGNEDDGGAGVGMDTAHQKSQSALALEEEAEEYLELFPRLAERLFEIFDVSPDKKQAPTKEGLEELEMRFNRMAEVFQTEDTNLVQRMNTLSKDLKESQDSLKDISNSLKDVVHKLKEMSKAPNVVPENILEVVKSLTSTSEEFELYSDSMCRNARRMGMMDVQNRLHKMLEVMILYVHIIRKRHDDLKSDYIDAKKLLDENKIAFSANRAIGSLPNNNNNDEKGLWEVEELENSHSDRCEDGDYEPEKILQHLLGPKKSTAGLNRKDRPIPKEKRTSDNLLVRYVAEWYEVLRRELFWPWNLEQTIKGLKQGFSVILMILGLIVFLRGFLPSVSAIDDGCLANPSFFKSVGAYFSYCGDLSHDDPPLI